MRGFDGVEQHKMVDVLAGPAREPSMIKTTVLVLLTFVVWS